MNKNSYIITAFVAAVAFNVMARPKEERLIGIENASVRIDSLNVEVRFTLKLDSLSMGSNQQFIYTPVVAGVNDSIELAQVVVNGRNQQLRHNRKPRTAANAVVVERKNGSLQSVDYLKCEAYEAWMDSATLILREDLCGCGDIENQSRYILAQVAHEETPVTDVIEIQPMLCFATPKVETVKSRHDDGRAFLDFPVNRTEILPNYRRNALELKKIIETIDIVRNDSNVTITGINIHGYASPEGSWASNARLAEGRARALKMYVQSIYDFPESVLSYTSTPEDWEGLCRLVAESGLLHTSEILDIANSDIDPDVKLSQIRKKYPAEYDEMLHAMFQSLRHSDYTVSYHVRPFNLEEARRIIKSKPQQLSLQEMMMVAQSYEAGSDEYNEVFEIAARMYPDDPTACLNAGIAALQRGDLNRAAQFLEKTGDTPLAYLAKGVLAMKQDNFTQARVYLTKAKEGGVDEAETNLKLLEQVDRKREIGNQ